VVWVSSHKKLVISIKIYKTVSYLDHYELTIRQYVPQEDIWAYKTMRPSIDLLSIEKGIKADNLEEHSRMRSTAYGTYIITELLKGG
jgi:hypothetical protein